MTVTERDVEAAGQDRGAPSRSFVELGLGADHPVTAVVTTRHGGASTGPYATLNLALHVGDDDATVIENRRRAAGSVGLGLDDLVFCHQTHGRRVAVVGAEHRGRGGTSLDDAVGRVDAVDGVAEVDGVDALVTATPGVGLVVMVADCVPVVLYDPVAHVLACVHAGWGGTVRLVCEAAVAAMATLGSRPSDVLAAIGPAVERERYQVGDEVADRARQAFGDDADTVVRPDGTGRWLFDLWAANRHTLVRAGLRDENVTTSAVGTADERFFSDRRARPCGRFAAIAVLHERPGPAVGSGHADQAARPDPAGPADQAARPDPAGPADQAARPDPAGPAGRASRAERQGS